MLFSKMVLCPRRGIMPITIYQGHHHSLAPADINIVIDVIRAFTVAHFAFIGGAKEILLVRTTEEAFKLKETYPDYVLTGEEKGSESKDLIWIILQNVWQSRIWRISG